MKKIEVSRWGEGIVETLAKDLQRAFPDMRGFSAQNLWRMKQIYETYKDREKLSTLLRELPWSHNVLIVHHTSSIEEKEFYIKICISERWSFRELQRQIESSLYERFMLSKKADKLIPHTKEKGFLAHFKDEYVFDFLGLKDNFTEGNLRKAILGNLKQFFLEFGRYFTFIGEEQKRLLIRNCLRKNYILFHCLRSILMKISYDAEVDALSIIFRGNNSDDKTSGGRNSSGITIVKGNWLASRF